MRVNNWLVILQPYKRYMFSFGVISMLLIACCVSAKWRS